MQFMHNAGPGKPAGLDLAEITGGDEENLRTFIAAHFGRTVIATGNKAIITIAQLPEDGTLAKLKLPDSVQIIGTAQRPPLNTELLFSTKEPVADFKVSFTSALSEAGWQQAPMFAAHGGFVGSVAENLQFCHPEREEVLHLTLQENGLGYINIRHQRKPCEDPHQGHMTIMNVLPSLSLPQDIEVQAYERGSGSSNSDSVHTSASIVSSANFTDFHNHYRQQLENLGWQLSHFHKDEHIAISTWQLNHEGDAWRGILLLIPFGESGRIQMRLEMQLL